MRDLHLAKNTFTKHLGILVASRYIVRTQTPAGDTYAILLRVPDREGKQVEISGEQRRQVWVSLGSIQVSTVSGGYRAGITKDKVSNNGSLHILREFVEIKGKPQMNEEMVRGNSTPKP